MYNIGHGSGTERGRCIVCGKVTSHYLTMTNYNSQEYSVGTSLRIPVCDEHREKIRLHKNMLKNICELVNKTIKEGL